MILPPPLSTLFPYTTLFRSVFNTEFQIENTLCVFLCMFSLIFFYTEFILKFIFSKLRFPVDRKSTRLNSSHVSISYAVFCLKKKKVKKCELKKHSIVTTRDV